MPDWPTISARRYCTAGWNLPVLKQAVIADQDRRRLPHQALLVALPEDAQTDHQQAQSKSQ